MRTYAELSHMKEIREMNTKSNRICYLPHHAVVKNSNPEGKIRVVFNASFYTKDGFSFSDVLLPGSKLQSDLWLVLTCWRMFRLAFFTDIVKMFRQIQIHKEDADLQKILWREDHSDEVREYRLLTVTYEVPPRRHTWQFVSCCNWPVMRNAGSHEVHWHTYVDDVLAGGDNLKMTTCIGS